MAFQIPRTWPPNLLVDNADMNIDIRDQLMEIQARVLAVEASLTGTQSKVAAIEAPWVAYTPTFTAFTTNPTIGTTNSQLSGSYKIVGKTCLGQARMVMGTGATPGSGNYYIGCPPAAPPKTSGAAAGGGWIQNETTDDNWTVATAISGAFLYMVFDAAATEIVASNNPFVWKAGDYLYIHWLYEII